jgi:tetratricopeptide (TPR) repeat protein
MYVSLRIFARTILWLLLFSGAAFPQQTANVSEQLRQAQGLIASGHSEAAEDLLSSILRQQASNPVALTLMGAVRTQQPGQETKAEEFFRKAIAADPKHITAWHSLGLLLLKMQRYPEALDTFEGGLKRNPRNGALRQGEVRTAIILAQTQLQAQDNESALISLLRANKFVTDDADLLAKLGILEDRMKVFHDADIALKRSLTLRPNDPTTLYALAHLKVDQQMPTEAAIYMQLYLALKPDDASAHYGMGRILRLSAKPEEAAVEYEKSIALRPEQTESYYDLAEMAVDANRDDKAEALLKRVLERDPRHGGALTEMGVIAFRRGDYVKAEQYLRDAVAAVPEYGPAHYQYALTLNKLGRKQEAQKEFATAYALNKPPTEKSSGTVQLTEPVQ